MSFSETIHEAIRRQRLKDEKAQTTLMRLQQIKHCVKTIAWNPASFSNLDIAIVTARQAKVITQLSQAIQEGTWDDAVHTDLAVELELEFSQRGEAEGPVLVDALINSQEDLKDTVIFTTKGLTGVVRLDANDVDLCEVFEALNPNASKAKVSFYEINEALCKLLGPDAVV